MLLDAQGTLDTWLAVDDDDDLYWALRAVEELAKTSEDDAVRILSGFLDRRPEKAAMVLRCFIWFQPDRPMPHVADLVIRALGLCDADALEHLGEGPLNLADGWVKHASADAGRILAAILENWYRHHATSTPFGDEAHHLHRDFHHFSELAEADPVTALKSVIPAMRLAMDRNEMVDQAPFDDRLWYSRRKDRGPGPHIVEFIDTVRSALQMVARDQPERIAELLAPFDPRRHMTALHLLLEAVSVNPALVPLLVEQADNPGLFKGGWHHADAFSAGKAMAMAWPVLEPAVRDRLEGRLMRLYPELKFAARCFRDSKAPAQEGNWSPDQYGSWARHSLANSGKTQWSTFRQLTNVELSPIALRRARELDRKFEGQMPEEPDGIHSGSSGSPIPSDRAKRMSDVAWLSAMKTDWSARPRRMGGAFRGDASDLARVLQEETKADPQRFLALYWKLPAHVPEVFARSIIHGLGETSLDTGELDALLDQLDASSPWQPDEHTLLWLITFRKGAALGKKAMAVLAEIAATGDTGRDHDAIGKEKDKPEPLFKVAMDVGHELSWRGTETARGKALDVVGRQAWHDQAAFERHRALVDRVLNEQVPGRLRAATGLFVQAAGKHSLPDAAKWLRQLLEKSPSALASDSGRAALLSLDQLDHDAARPLLLAMLEGSDEALSALAAALIFFRSFDDPRWSPERKLILEGNAEWRAAAAHVAANEVDRDVHDADLNALIIDFFNDESDLVRTAAADVFRSLDTGAMATHADLYRGYLNSKSFVGERTYFLHRLEDAPAAFDSLVIEIVELAVTKVSTAATNRGTIGYRLWEPLMRIYTSNERDADVRKRCLDVIDTLIANDIGGSDKLQEATR